MRKRFVTKLNECRDSTKYNPLLGILMNPNGTGVSSAVFASAVIVLIVVAASGFGLYATKPQVVSTTTVTSTNEMTNTMTETMTNTMTETMTTTMTGNMTQTSTSAMTHEAIAFTPRQGQMIGNAWLLVEPAGMNGQYALSIYAPGLEQTMGTGNVYLVEAAQASGSMASVPVTGNVTTSEFEVGSNGVGQFFALLSQNPYTTFENVQIFYLAGMQMSNATLVATAALGMSGG